MEATALHLLRAKAQTSPGAAVGHATVRLERADWLPMLFALPSPRSASGLVENPLFPEMSCIFLQTSKRHLREAFVSSAAASDDLSDRAIRCACIKRAKNQNHFKTNVICNFGLYQNPPRWHPFKRAGFLTITHKIAWRFKLVRTERDSFERKSERERQTIALITKRHSFHLLLKDCPINNNNNNGPNSFRLLLSNSQTHPWFGSIVPPSRNLTRLNSYTLNRK